MKFTDDLSRSLSQAIKDDTSLLPEIAVNILDITDKVGKMHLKDNGKPEQLACLG
jgi:hypothetical protein